MRKLSRIILINAAGFDYLEFPVGGHSQVIGVNGHGKSTVLRTVLFFYLGTNEKAPYALHETKSDFISYYLGEPPSYLIYEVERGEGMPAFHVAVTRPAGRVQFHFVDAPYTRSDYVEGSMVQPVQSVLERLRDGGKPVDSVNAYEQFVQRIYGIVSSPYAVFRPVARSSGQIGVLARIISGIFTVSQLDADKLKTALTCGMRSEVSSGELDLALLKGQLENFRRVNRAVKTYLQHEEEALNLVDLVESYDMARTMRSDAIRSLICAAKRLPEEIALRDKQRQGLDAQKEAELKRFEGEDAILQESLQQLNGQIAVLRDKIRNAEVVEAEYQQRDIEGKSAKLRQLPALKDEKQLADEEHRTLTAQYQDENQRKEALFAQIREIRSTQLAQFATAKTASERTQREVMTQLEEERSRSLAFLEEQFREEQDALAPRRRGCDEVRNALNGEFRQLADLSEPPDLAKTQRALTHEDRNFTRAKGQLSELNGQLNVLKVNAEKEQQEINHRTKEERDTLQRQIDGLTARKTQLERELEAFDDSLARFYQTHAPEFWPQAARTLRRDALFHNAAELNARKSPEAGGVWGVELSTDALPEPEGGFDRGALVALVEEVRQNLLDAKDCLQAAHERYLADYSALERRTAEQQTQLQSEVAKATELRNRSSNEILRLESSVETLKAQWENARRELRENLEARHAKLEAEAEEIRREQSQIEERFKQKKATVTEEYSVRRARAEEEARARMAVIGEEEAAASREWEAKRDEIEQRFHSALAEKGVDADLLEGVRARIANLTEKIAQIATFEEEVTIYQSKKRELLDHLPAWHSELRIRVEAHESKQDERKRALERHQQLLGQIRQQISQLELESRELRKDEDETRRFREDPRFLTEQAYFDRDDLPPATFYRAGAVAGFLKEAESAHQQREELGRKGDKDARSFLNRFDPETLDRRVLGFSPLHAHFEWFIFARTELQPFVDGSRIDKMKQIQTQEFEQLIRNISGKNAAFREGIRQVNQTAALVQKNLEANNFVDVLDSVELKVERVDNKLTQILEHLEEFSDLTFAGDNDLFGKRADRDQAEKAIAAFERLLREIDAHKGSTLRLTDCFDFLIRVHENGHDMGWRKSLDHIGSTGTDYLVKMLIYLSLIEVYRERTIDSRDGHAAVHCVMDETGVLAAKYIRSVLDYARERQIILITAGHSQQTVGFENWMLVRKRGKRFGGQAVLRKVLKCD